MTDYKELAEPIKIVAEKHTDTRTPQIIQYAWDRVWVIEGRRFDGVEKIKDLQFPDVWGGGVTAPPETYFMEFVKTNIKKEVGGHVYTLHVPRDIIRTVIPFKELLERMREKTAICCPQCFEMQPNQETAVISCIKCGTDIFDSLAEECIREYLQNEN